MPYKGREKWLAKRNSKAKAKVTPGRAHVDRTLEEKLKVISRIENGEKAKHIGIELGISASTISGWMAKKEEIRDKVENGLQLDRMRDRPSFLPELDRAMCLWLRGIRMKYQRAPPVSELMLGEKAEQ
jgi:hypothetical protein